MRPNKPFMSLQCGDDMTDPVSVILPDDAEVEEHTYKGVHFIVHHYPLGIGDMWVATERTTGRTLTQRKQSLTKDRAIQEFTDAVDAVPEDELLNGLMDALLETEDAPILSLGRVLSEDRRRIDNVTSKGL